MEVVDFISAELEDADAWKHGLDLETIKLTEEILGDTFYQLGFLPYSD